MDNLDSTVTQQPVDRHMPGPQGTRLFSTEKLRQYADEVDRASAGRASVREPVLQGISPPDLADQRFSLRPGRQTLGRHVGNDIVVNETSVSGSHAWIMNQQGQHFIMNTLSTNGTFVNDKRIHEARLKHGDHIRLGQAEFVFLTREPGTASGWNWRRTAAWLIVLAALLGGLAWWWLA